MRSEVQIFPDPPEFRSSADPRDSHIGNMLRHGDRPICKNLELRSGRLECGMGEYPHGAIAQLGERLPCTQEVGGSIPPGSTKWYQVNKDHEVAIMRIRIMPVVPAARNAKLEA